MTPEALYRQVVVLDREQHRTWRMRPQKDFRATRRLNAAFVTVVEFADVAREYPIVFVRAGKDEATGLDHIACIALLGLAKEQNLYLMPDGSWDARYYPAFLRRYPFGMAQGTSGRRVVCIDGAYDGWVTDAPPESPPLAGEMVLFDAAGEPTPYLEEMRKFLDAFDAETERTQHFGARLRDLGLLQDMHVDAKLPDGQALVVDGFMAINTEKLAQLPDATVVELHRNGILGLLALQQASLGLIERLFQRRLARAD